MFSVRMTSDASLVRHFLRHMTSVLGYARTFAVGGSSPVNPAPLASFDAEIGRFHEVLESVGGALGSDGSPIPPENFIYADVRQDSLGRVQSEPARPDVDWPERPA